MTNDPITIIKDDHRTVEELFKAYEELGDEAFVHKRDIADRIIENLTVHAEMEEAICYPRFKEALNDEDDKMIEEAYVEHAGAKDLLSDLSALKADDPKFDASMKVLMEQIRHHVEEEEDELLPKVKKEISEDVFKQMGDEMMEFKRAHGTAPTA